MYDFGGWATKNNLRCSDGRVIRKDAFKDNDGRTVPLVWNHDHNSPTGVLGHALLTNKEDGVWADCVFNESDSAKAAKETVKHGDIVALSIWANQLQHDGNDVIHGMIREVSLVHAGANPGAFIESVLMHGEPMDLYDDEGILFTGENLSLSHSEDSKSDKDKNEDNDKTVKEVLDTLTDEQKAAVGILVSGLTKDGKNEDDDKDDDSKEDKGGKDEMKHNVFDTKDGKQQGYLSHADMKQVFDDAKKCGSFREALHQHMEDGVLAHASLPSPIPTTGFDTPTGTQDYGINDMSMLFPDYKSLNDRPEFISRRMDWVSLVINGVHRSPFSRVKSVFADITEDEARAKGYIKGNMKKNEVFSILKRVTDPKTVYKKQKFDRDDILDMGNSFDFVAWVRAEMRMMLEEEIARAILIGDGRLASSEDKISEDHIRPIATEHPLLNVQIPVKVAADATEEEIAKETIRVMIKSRKQYRGKGSPTFWTNDDVITDMLLIEDGIGRRLYKTEQELTTAVRASSIVPVEVMEGQKLVVNGVQYPLIGILVNLDDYNVGTDKGGEITNFDDFDIDYNQYVYLTETRMSGALTKPFSALTFYLDKSDTATASTRSTKASE